MRGLLLAVLLLMASSLGCGVARSLLGGPAEGDPEQLLAEALRNFQQAQSYRFTLQAVHRWSFEGKPQEWSFSGEGAFRKPDNFASRVQGPADTDMRLTILAGRVRAQDARGEVPNPTPAFGAPGVGTAPFTVIAYLKSAEQPRELQAATVDGAAGFRVSFRPKLAQVAALDGGHARAMGRVSQVQGTVFIDQAQRMIREETVTVHYTAPDGQPQSADITLRFFDYNQPVEIQ